jgi:hypothetical protein
MQSSMACSPAFLLRAHCCWRVRLQYLEHGQFLRTGDRSSISCAARQGSKQLYTSVEFAVCDVSAPADQTECDVPESASLYFLQARALGKSFGFVILAKVDRIVYDDEKLMGVLPHAPRCS